MGALIPVAVSMLAATTAAVVAVGAAVVAVVTTIVSAIGVIALTVGSFVAGAVTGVLTGLGVMTSLTAATTLQSLGMLNLVSVSTFASIAGAVGAVATSFKTFLDVIHFKTLLRVHQIAQLLSKDYRQMVNKVYSEVSKYSEALNLGAHFIPLVLENTRAIVLDVSAMTGRSYDLGQVAWLRELNEWAKKAEDTGERYKNHPELVLQDINDWIVKPNIDTKGQIVGNIFSTLENVIEITDELAKDALNLSEDVEKFIHDLPEDIRKEINPKILEITSKVTDFIVKDYGPTVGTIKDIQQILNKDIDEQKGKLGDIVDRLLRPGDYLQEVYDLPEHEWTAQQAKVAEVVYRHEEPVDDMVAQVMPPQIMELARIVSTLKLTLEKVAWHTPEIETPVRKAISEIDKSMTWFSGDY